MLVKERAPHRFGWPLQLYSGVCFFGGLFWVLVWNPAVPCFTPVPLLLTPKTRFFFLKEALQKKKRSVPGKEMIASLSLCLNENRLTKSTEFNGCQEMRLWRFKFSSACHMFDHLHVAPPVFSKWKKNAQLRTAMDHRQSVWKLQPLKTWKQNPCPGTPGSQRNPQTKPSECCCYLLAVFLLVATFSTRKEKQLLDSMGEARQWKLLLIRRCVGHGFY